MARKRGNQGYGKAELVRTNVDKFSPVFWALMEKLSKSKKSDDIKLFITEFNKLQVKLIPTKLEGDEDGAPIKLQWLSQSPTIPVTGPTTSTIQVSAG